MGQQTRKRDLCLPKRTVFLCGLCASVVKLFLAVARAFIAVVISHLQRSIDNVQTMRNDYSPKTNVDALTMSNYWETNWPAGQGGDYTFRPNSRRRLTLSR